MQATAVWAATNSSALTDNMAAYSPSIRHVNTLNTIAALSAAVVTPVSCHCYLLLQASLARLQLDYVDVLFCHRPDPDTPIEVRGAAETHLVVTTIV